MYVDLFDRLEERGFTDLSQESMLEDPETAQKLMQAMQEIWQEITAESMKITVDIREMNHKTARSVSAVLSPESGRAFRHAFYSAGYPEVGHLLSLEDQAWMSRALELETIDDDTRATLAAILADFRRQVDRIVEETVQLITDQRGDFSPFDFDQSGNEESQKEIAKLAARAQELHGTMMTSVQELLGPEWTRLAESTTQPATEAEVIATAEPEEEQEQVWSGDQFIPVRISFADTRRWAKTLELDDGNASVLKELHLGYVDEFKTLASIEELKQANAKLWAHYPGSGESHAPDEGEIAIVYKLRRRALGDIIDLDTRFLDDVEIAVVSDEMKPRLALIRGQRMRQSYQQNAGAWYGRSGASAAAIDVAALLDARDITPETRTRITPILARYDAKALGLIKERYEAQLEFQRASDVFNAQQQRPGSFEQVDYALEYRKALGEPTERVQAATMKVAELNTRIVEEIAAALDGAGGREIRHAFRLAAFPMVYGDQASVEMHLTRAQELGDLQPEQRRQLDELAATYRPAYERLSTEMVDIVGQGGMNTIGFDTDDWQEYQKRQEQVQKLLFDRNELNYRAISRLSAILHEDQVARIGGLPRPSDDDVTQIYW
jgi:hypothetical protein